MREFKTGDEVILNHGFRSANMTLAKVGKFYENGNFILAGDERGNKQYRPDGYRAGEVCKSDRVVHATEENLQKYKESFKRAKVRKLISEFDSLTEDIKDVDRLIGVLEFIADKERVA